MKDTLNVNGKSLQVHHHIQAVYPNLGVYTLKVSPEVGPERTACVIYSGAVVTSKDLLGQVLLTAKNAYGQPSTSYSATCISFLFSLGLNCEDWEAEVI